MKPLRQIYNPVSDTHLVLYGDPDKGYGVARRMHSLARTRLGLEWFKAQKDAVCSFEKRLLDEANLSIFALKARYKISGASFYNMTAASESEPFGKGEYDAQQFMLYEAEQIFFRREQPITRREATDLCARIADDYKIKTPSLAFKKNQNFLSPFLYGFKSAANYNWLLNKISYFGEENIRADISAHEMAHAVTNKYFPKATQHGPYFAMVSTQIYVRHLGVNPDRIIDHYNKLGLYGPKDVSKDIIMSPFVEQSPHTSFKPAFR